MDFTLRQWACHPPLVAETFPRILDAFPVFCKPEVCGIRLEFSHYLAVLREEPAWNTNSSCKKMELGNERDREP